MSARLIVRLVALSIGTLWLGACVPQTQTVGTAFRSPALFDHVAIMPDATRLPLRAWKAENPRAIIVGVHGFNDYARAFEMPGQWFADRGVTFYAFDQRGFGKAPAPGKWAGTAPMVNDLKTLVSLIRTSHPGLPLFVLGSSMGGAVTIAAAADGDLQAEGIVLAAPAVWGWSSLNLLYRSTLWMSAHTLPHLALTGQELGRMPSDNIEMLRALGADPLVIKETRVDAIYGLVGLMDEAYLSIEKVQLPTLYLYGARDEIVPREPTQEVAARFGNDLTYIEYADGWHMLLRDLKREIVWRDVLSWVDGLHTEKD